MATEKRLIFLQDAIDIIANTPSEIANGVTRGSKKHWTANDVLGVLADRQFEIFVLLDNVKRVDAVEEVHGRWEDRENPQWKAYDIRHCSVCGWSIPKTKLRQKDSHWNYCPNCGAKMDGERKDNG